MNQKNLLFWQPKFDFLRTMSMSKSGMAALVILNYLIWVFLFYISYLLIKNDTNTFWQILIATIISEFIEKVLKRKMFWRRPMFVRHDQTPPGLVKKWYETGSFPSGHTIKAVFFLLLIWQYHVFSVPAFISVAGLLLLFRVLVGFHYPIDILGGFGFGLVIWQFVHQLSFPDVLNQFIRVIFNFVFFVK